MRRITIGIAILVAVVGTVAVGIKLQSPPAPLSPYTKTNFERLEPGMSLADAVAILGEPTRTNMIMPEMWSTIWISPLSSEEFINGWYIPAKDEFSSFEHVGELPDEPLRMPDEMPEIAMTDAELRDFKHFQDTERRRFLMLDPPRQKAADPRFP